MKDSSLKDLLIIGIGNSGRQDDGIAWRILDQLESVKGIDLEYRYQLQIEDAELISKYSRIIFVDASEEKYDNGFHYYAVQPTRSESYSTHSIPPEHILFLCQDLYEVAPECKLLAVTGFEWELKIGISDQGRKNMDSAIEFLFNLLEKRIDA